MPRLREVPKAEVGSETIGTLAAKNTALYQSFNGAWLLIMSCPNTLPSSGGSSTIYVSMTVTQIQSQLVQTGTQFGTRMTEFRISKSPEIW